MEEDSKAVEQSTQEEGVTTTTGDSLDTNENAPQEVEQGYASDTTTEGESTESSNGGESEEDTVEYVDYTSDAFSDAKDGAMFKDANGNVLKKLEGCDVPVPVIPDDDPMLKFLADNGFDQHAINDEFWTGNGVLTDDTRERLIAVFGPGPVDGYMKSVMAAYDGYMFRMASGEEDKRAALAAQAAAVEKRDNDIYSAVGKVFDADGIDAQKTKVQEMIDFANGNWPVERRKELKSVLDSGSEFMLGTMLKAMRREMEFTAGTVHKMLDVSDSPAAGGDSDGLGALSREQFAKLAVSSEYMNDAAYAKKVDAARSRGIKAERSRR